MCPLDKVTLTLGSALGSSPVSWAPVIISDHQRLGSIPQFPLAQSSLWASAYFLTSTWGSSRLSSHSHTFFFLNEALPPPPGCLPPDTYTHLIPRESTHSASILLSTHVCQATSWQFLHSSPLSLFAPSPCTHGLKIPKPQLHETEPGPCSPLAPGPGLIAIAYRYSVNTSEGVPMKPMGGS